MSRPKRGPRFHYPSAIDDVVVVEAQGADGIVLTAWGRRPFRLLGQTLVPYFVTAAGGREKPMTWSQIMSQFIEQILTRAPNGAGTLAFNDPEFKKTYPRCHDLLTVTKTKAGERQPSSYSIFNKFNQVSLWLNLNDDLDRYVVVSARTMAGLCDALEGTLTREAVPWRYRNQDGSTSRKQRRQA